MPRSRRAASHERVPRRAVLLSRARETVEVPAARGAGAREREIATGRRARARWHRARVVLRSIKGWHPRRAGEDF